MESFFLHTNIALYKLWYFLIQPSFVYIVSRTILYVQYVLQERNPNTTTNTEWHLVDNE